MNNLRPTLHEACKLNISAKIAGFSYMAMATRSHSVCRNTVRCFYQRVNFGELDVAMSTFMHSTCVGDAKMLALSTRNLPT